MKTAISPRAAAPEASLQLARSETESEPAPCLDEEVRARILLYCIWCLHVFQWRCTSQGPF